MSLSGLLFNLADVRCEHCQKKLKWNDVNANVAMVCHSCKHEMPIQARSENTAHISFDKNLVRPSEYVELQREGSISILKKQWRSKNSKYVIMGASLYQVLWWIAAIATYFHRQSDETAVRIGLLVLFGGIGLVIFYRLLQELLNTTTVMLKNDKVVVGTGPIYLGGGMKIYRADEILSFTVWKMDPEKHQGRPQFSFGVDLHTKDGRLERLCPASNLNEAIYIEKTIEELLHIESGAAVDHFAV